METLSKQSTLGLATVVHTRSIARDGHIPRHHLVHILPF